MPPRLSLRSVAGRSSIPLRRVTANPSSSVCLFCSLAARPNSPTPRRTRRKSLVARRNQSTTTSSQPSNPRKELQDALQELQKHATNYINLSRVQLALNALRQEAGDETVRVAILGLTNGSESGLTAKEVLRLLLADPLSPEQDWERELMAHDARQPLIVRVGTDHEDGAQGAGEGTMTYARGGLLREMSVSSPGLNGKKLEILLTETNPLADSTGEAFQNFEESALVPTVDIPASNTGRFTPVTTPVHKALLVTDGILGAASLANLPLLSGKGAITGAVNTPGYTPADPSALPFATIDVTAAAQGLNALRQSVDKGFEYEKLWFKSNMPSITTWLKSGVTTSGDGATKDAIRESIASVLLNTRATIQQEEAQRLSSALSNQTSSTTVPTLNAALSEWAEKSHAELQEQLDQAFTGSRWRKLNWWKLFWRVDDVGTLSSEMLSQRFLPGAERNVIFLAGKIEGSGVFGTEARSKAPYSAPTLATTAKATEAAVDPSQELPLAKKSLPGTKWPAHITYTRNYLQSETVPALQALAQSLVFQSAGFSTLTTSLGALMYLSTFGASESGAVAALGIVWSLRRLQKKWESAREYWQSEVREEGRKAVRAVEISVGETLDKAVRDGSAANKDALLAELRQARELVRKAEDALAKLK
ncbi:hypothetical protein J7T55_005095 [Diaporthe amygdali]|uniref:uncharacterized protein n=1 Tax=Phomopsis amygdali TaxID=1214568 RepID=UPI0022FE64F3|nr:uncharacterized protein J7T55_005095 [Diaporthe amygdali]KAJ0116149.1 hypothetical protein J7T55_005095 [Diaporthe amygdali]